MHARRTVCWPVSIGVLFVSLAFATLGETAGAAPARQDATPTASYSCDAAPPVASPTMDDGEMGDMEMGSPMAEMAAEFDQLYIDMMIPHHASVVALAQAALPRLTDERLQEIAQTIIDTQSAEIEELRGYREQFYGSAESDPMPMDAQMMSMMEQAMPGMGSMEEMAFQMDAAAQVATFCAATDPDLTFIDQTTPHHEMAIVASETALTQATNQGIKDFAQRVIDDQQREIDELTQIRVELTGEATPAS
jgi:uncharacterized protein (DUF305 family)